LDEFEQGKPVFQGELLGVNSSQQLAKMVDHPRPHTPHHHITQADSARTAKNYWTVT